MKNLPSPEELRPKMKTYLLGKEVEAVSLADALRKERGAPVIEIREVYKSCDSES